MTPHELEQGRALLASWNALPDRRKVVRDNDSTFRLDALNLWLRNHAAELLADSAALADERAHADRLAEAARKVHDATMRFVEQPHMAADTLRWSTAMMDCEKMLAAHAARREAEVRAMPEAGRKETNDAAR